MVKLSGKPKRLTPEARSKFYPKTKVVSETKVASKKSTGRSSKDIKGGSRVEGDQLVYFKIVNGEEVITKRVPLSQARPWEHSGKVQMRSQSQMSEQEKVAIAEADGTTVEEVEEQESIAQQQQPTQIYTRDVTRTGQIVGESIATPTQQSPAIVPQEYESAAQAFSEPSLLKRGHQQYQEGTTTEDKLKAIQTMYQGGIEATPIGRGMKERRLSWEEKVKLYEAETQTRIERLKAEAEKDIQRHANIMHAKAEKDLMKQSVTHPDVSYQDKQLTYSTEEGLLHIQKVREQAAKKYESEGAKLQQEWATAMESRSKMEQRRFAEGMPIIEKSPFAKAEEKIASVTTKKALSKQAPKALSFVMGHSIAVQGLKGGLKAREQVSEATGLKPSPKLLKFESKVVKHSLEFEKGLGEGAYKQIRNKPLSTATFVGVGILSGGIGVIAKGSKIASWSLRGVGATAGVTYAGMKGVEAYLTPGAKAKGEVVGGAGVQVGAVLAGSTIGGSLASKGKAKYQEFRFNRKVSKWEKGLVDKELTFQRDQKGMVIVERKSGAVLPEKQTQLQPKPYDIYQKYQRPILAKKGVSYHRQARLGTKTTEKLKLESGKTLYREIDMFEGVKRQLATTKKPPKKGTQLTFEDYKPPRIIKRMGRRGQIGLTRQLQRPQTIYDYEAQWGSRGALRRTPITKQTSTVKSIRGTKQVSIAGAYWLKTPFAMPQLQPQKFNLGFNWTQPQIPNLRQIPMQKQTHIQTIEPVQDIGGGGVISFPPPSSPPTQPTQPPFSPPDFRFIPPPLFPEWSLQERERETRYGMKKRKKPGSTTLLQEIRGLKAPREKLKRVFSGLEPIRGFRKKQKRRTL